MGQITKTEGAEATSEIAEPTSPASKWAWQFVLPLLLGASLLGAVLWSGTRAREILREQEARTIAFTDVECDPPAGMVRQEFLEEAQYLAQLPERLNALEVDTNAKIAEALAMHPWVAQVKSIEQRPGGKTLARIRYRVPVLAIDQPPRAVDGHGVLLPLSAKREGLPVLLHCWPPSGKPGQPWGDSRVRATARVVSLLRPQLEVLGLSGCTIEVAEDEVTLRTSQTTVHWGRPPGEERPGEPTAEQKLKWIQSRLPGKGGDLDLRKQATEDRRGVKPSRKR